MTGQEAVVSPRMKRTVGSYLRPYAAAIALALVQVLILNGLELLKPWPLKIIIDHVLSGEPLPWNFVLGWAGETIALFACVALVLIYLLVGVLHLVHEYTTIRIGQSMVNDLRRDLYSHVQRLSFSFHNRQQIGELMYRITADTMSLQTLTMNGLFTVVSAAALLSGMFIIML
ncbi:MAG TPA: ABC transporter transmembrane domain-containing protein, partial [Terriglobales bacterium]|nr:ABC transporter transmembrane domain-containing protein [Terriglobales bacterium]